MKKLLLFVLLLPTFLFAQSYNIGHASIVFYDSIRNRNITTEIYYPADNPGLNEPVSVGSFPVLVFGHGFLMSLDSYQNFWDEIVPNGYVICFPTTEMGITPDHQQFGKDLKFLAEQMQIETQDSNSLFFNSLAPETALLGHSMGGGASFLAAENNSNINTLINFAAAETNPSAISVSVNVYAPTLIFSADDDCVTPPVQNQDLMYDSLSSNCKTHISIIDGGHCYFANEDILCSLGESSCNPSLNITREEQQLITFDFLYLWLRYTLYNDQTAFNIFNDSLQSSQRINYSKSCDNLSIQNSTNNSRLRIYPNPSNDIFNIVFNSNTKQDIDLKIHNVLGEVIFSKTLTEFSGYYNKTVDMTPYPNAIYILQLNTKDGMLNRKLVLEK